jgi:hypothetical protein
MNIDFIAVAAGWAEASGLAAVIVWSIPAMKRSVGYLRHMLREAARLGNSVPPGVSGKYCQNNRRTRRRLQR